MKRKLSLFLVLCMMLSAFVSCSEDQNDPADTTGTASGSETQASTDTGTPEEEFIPHYEYTPSIVADPDFYFVENGTSDYVIVYRENADNATNYNMALELQSYIEKITGVQLPLVTDETEAVDHEIVIGLTNRETEGQFDRTALTDQGFEIDVRESGKVFIAGGDDLGTQYGVYHFVDEYLGCGLYSPEFEYIPDYDSLGLAYGEDVQIPVFLSRTVGCKLYYGYQEKMKMGGHSVHAGHTLPRVCGGFANSGDPCLSAESTYTAAMDYVLGVLEANPDTYYIGIGQQDGPTYCTCDTCLASYDIYGYSGHYLRFINRIADAIRDDYPNTLICTFAYDFTNAPPMGGVVPSENVSIQFCMSECCRIHPLADYNFGTTRKDIYMPDNITFGELLGMWSDICDKIAIYHYSPNYGAYNSITPNILDLYDDVQLFYENNAKYVYIAGNTLSKMGEFDELRTYLISKIMWNPQMSREEYYAYMNKFLCEFYGPGWEYIRAFIELADEETADHCLGESTMLFADPISITPMDNDYIDSLIAKIDLSALTIDQITDPSKVDWDSLYEQIPEEKRNFNRLMADGYIYFAKATELAETDEQRAHIDQSSIQLDVNYSTLIYKNSLPRVNILKRIYLAAIKPFIESGAITDIDSYTYIYRFESVILDSIYSQQNSFLREFNEALYEKMMKYGITHLMESNNSFINIPKEQMEFTNPPTGGYGTSYTSWYPHA
ncbi:MAG: DUF4838 domain-containing protein [Clostridia bacterium]|nr:DUF4838 domain-containing protein [Clostridia bacterium]